MPPRMPSGRAHDTAHVRLAGHPLPGLVNTISHNLPHFNHGLFPPVTFAQPLPTATSTTPASVRALIRTTGPSLEPGKPKTSL
jgi:hypothetical protein